MDASHPQLEMQLDAVHHVLDEIGGLNKPMIYVFNKIDDPSGARSAEAIAPSVSECDSFGKNR